MGVGVGIGVGVGEGVGGGVGEGVGLGVGDGLGIGDGLGSAVAVGVVEGTGVGVAFGRRLGLGVGSGVGVTVGSGPICSTSSDSPSSCRAIAASWQPVSSSAPANMQINRRFFILYAPWSSAGFVAFSAAASFLPFRLDKFPAVLQQPIVRLL